MPPALHMRKQGGGHINFSDWVAKSGRRGTGLRAVLRREAGIIADGGARAGLTGDILVNAMAGPIRLCGISDEERKNVEKSTPLGRWGGEIEIAKGVLGLLDSDFITGAPLRIDGGRHLP